MPRTTRSPQVHKFGGASVANAAAIAHAVTIVNANLPGPLVVVVSALAGVTDALFEIAAGLERGEGRGLRDAIDALHERHAEIARTLFPGSVRRRAVLADVDEAFRELERLVAAPDILRELTPRTLDYVVARGERLSARLFTGALAAGGCRVEYVPAVDVIKTNATFGQASADLGLTERAARKVLRPLLRRGVIPVVPGFLGSTAAGQLTTLGRGGSDLTATLLARALGAREVSLWKDVPGLLTADPRIVPDARVAPQLHVREAAELAYYGAKVLHPRALIPLVKRNIAVRIRPFASPGSRGTEISRRRTLAAFPVKALSAIPGQALLTVTGSGMLGVPGIAARTFAAVHQEGISVSLISQASSEHSICFSVPEEHAARARTSLLKAFQLEIERREIDGVEVRKGVATLAVVGLGMAEMPGVAARVFSALGEAGINVIAIAQGSSELNLSLVVEGRDAAGAQRVVHTAFQLSKIGGGMLTRLRHTDVVLLGFGLIGRAVASMIAKAAPDTGALRVLGVIDRTGFVFDPNGISPRRLALLAGAKARGKPLKKAGGREGTALEAVTLMVRHALANPVLVDVTADDTGDVLTTALAAGMHVVLANKRPLTSARAQYDEIFGAATAHDRELLHEATVGAGLPVIDTYHKLTESGDRVSQIEACPSGTLSYLFAELGRGRTFSEALRGAIAKGYTEPDPRDDLSGTDVARKALILGRLLGFRGELADIRVESLVPPAARKVALPEFLNRLEKWDDDWRRRIEKARAAGGVLRYRAIATRRRIEVGLVAVPPSSPLASLNGTDNQFIFTTMRYRKNPLVITGPGAGPAVTAGGILNDILELANA